ncbi:MAG TPA: chloride channel protein, partial [Armatimonadota bacterium]|nr:chloride channel protein [Armatimonadota bacterium]
MNTAISSVKPNPPFPHALCRRILLRRRRNNQFFRAALVGLLAGALAVLFQEALSQGEQLRIHFLAELKQYPHWGWVSLPLLAAFLGGFVSWMTARFAPEASGSGIPHVKGVLIHIRSLDWRKLLPVKFIGGVLAISAGFSLGREGPSVQMGSAAANCLSDLLHVPRRERQHLLACGAGAGLAAAFNAPLAGFLFVIEELQHELSLTTYGTALIATLVADLMTRAFIGQSPSFHFHGYPTPPLTA